MASSMWDVNHSPTLARLNLKRSGRKIGAWAARVNNHNQWLRIDLGGPRSVKCRNIASVVQEKALSLS